MSLGRAVIPVTLVSRALVVWAWGPSTGFILASLRCELWGQREDVPGGGASCRRQGRLQLGARPGAGSRGPLPTCFRRGCAGMGPQHFLFGVRTLGAAARRGGGGMSSRGG